MHVAKFCIAATGVRGINTCSPLVYLLRDQLIPTDRIDDKAGDYPGLDHEIIACIPMLKLDKLEKGRPKKRWPTSTLTNMLCLPT